MGQVQEQPNILHSRNLPYLIMIIQNLTDLFGIQSTRVMEIFMVVYKGRGNSWTSFTHFAIEL